MNEPIYQSDPHALPDTGFEPGELSHLVPGNRGRFLDHRRTPFRVEEVMIGTGLFRVRIEAFEDRGAVWEIRFERVEICQFAGGEKRLSSPDVDRLDEIARRLARPLLISAEGARAGITAEKLTEETEGARAWLRERSRFPQEDGRLPDPETRQGDPRLYEDLRDYLEQQGLLDLEARFATRFVSNPDSGELVKGHRIVLAEIGLVSFRGTVIRDPDLFTTWSKELREKHLLTRMGFLRALFGELGIGRVPLYRGLSTTETVGPPRNESFVSATFSENVARSHFESAGPESHGRLLRQLVPVERLFMTYLETEAMNRQFKEAEAVLLFEEGNPLF